MSSTVAVVGGGLAGIAAAVRLAEAGRRPIVIETRRKLGGRATSFDDARSGETLDNCQHVVMGCCTNLLDLYDRLGVLDRIEWQRSTWWADPPNEPCELRPGRLPAPAHFTGSFLAFRILPFAARRAVARGIWRILRLGLHGRARWSSRTFADFLREARQPVDAVERFWEPIVVSACNLPSDRVAAGAALQVFQEGFLASPFASAIGLSTVPLVDLYGPARAIIEAAGGEVRLGVSARALAFDRDRLTGVITDEDAVDAGAVISSVPWDRLSRLCSDSLRAADPRLRRLDAFEPSPILGVHLFFDRAVMTTPNLVLPGRSVQWLFDKGAASNGRFHVHAVVSSADAWMDLDEREIVRRTLADLRWAIPSAAGIEPVESRSVKERRATFALTPGIEALRPGAAPDLVGLGAGCRNLFLAGDWCRTGWPATMEGAVRSGYAAAQAVTGSGGCVPGLPVGRMARLLGLR